MGYAEEIQKSVDNQLIAKEDIYEFEGSDFEELLSKYYQFCRENLDIHSKDEAIVPNVLLFTNSFEVNAGAGIKNEHFVITINLGLFQSCVHNYYNNGKLAAYFQTLYPETIGHYDNPVNILAFQVCTQFTYYHELAHLFQFSGQTAELQLQERNDKEPQVVFDRTRHVLEINADTYASIAITSHIEQYVWKVFGENVTSKNIQETLVFFCCCLLNYTLNFSEKPEAIYFEEHTHPHSFIRLLNAVLNITNHIENTPRFKQKGILLNGHQLFLTTIEVYKDLEAKGVFQTNMAGIINANKELHVPLTQYLFSLIQFEACGYQNAMEIWNKHAAR